jgi:hypothetical protein
MAQLERRASMQRLYATKALLLARSGLEDALARLSGGQDASSSGNAYGGENWDGVLPGQLSSYEASQQVFNPTGVNTAADVETCPVRQAMRPSFFTRSAGNPAVMPVEGRDRGYSGALVGDRMLNGNTYALKVEDESAKINVNGGFLDALNCDAASGDAIPDHRDPDVRPDPADPKDTGLGWNFQLARILNILGNQPEVGLPTLGTDVLTNRPLGGYRSLRDLAGRIGTSKDLSPWLTVSSWVDAGVVHPNAYLGQVAGGTAPNDVKKGRRPLDLEQGGRPAVNLNAAERSVLVALIQGLKGTSWQDVTQPRTYEIPAPMAGAIADALLAARRARPFASWGEFSAFCDGLVPAVIRDMSPGASYGGGNLCGADLLKANFDPNTGCSEQAYDQIRWRWLDKADLLAWSTEGDLAPTGSFTLACAGRVLGRDGRLLAEAVRTASVEAFSLLRQTSQRDFVGGRTLADLPRYLSLASTGERTTGISAGSAAWWGGPPGPGLAVVTYPCPPTALPGQAADFDGAVGLATVELEPVDPPGGTLKFLHHFDDGWDADVGSPGALMPGGYDASLQHDVGTGVWPVPPREPNTLYPDGIHVQPGRVPSYAAYGNLPTQTSDSWGVVGYWVKPVYLKPDMDFTCVRDVTQALAIGRGIDAMGSCEELWGTLAENCVSRFDRARERVYARRLDPVRPSVRWNLVTALWNTGATTLGEDVRLTLAGARGPGWEILAYSSYGHPFDQALKEPLVIPGLRFALGDYEPFGAGSGNHVLDELAICDFGSIPSTAKSSSDAWAADRYRDGRYYKGNDGAFLSVPLSPDAGRAGHLLGVRWTVHLPRESRQEILVWDEGPLPDSGRSRVLDPSLQEACIGIDLMDGSGSAVLRPGLAPGVPVGPMPARFRYRVTFKPTPGWTPSERLNQPVLETPFFDDITFAWQPMSGPRILAWERP